MFFDGIGLSCFLSLALAPALLSTYEDTKIYAKERLVSVIVVVLFFFFFFLLSLKVRVAMRFIAQTCRGFKCEFSPRLA